MPGSGYTTGPVSGSRGRSTGNGGGRLWGNGGLANELSLYVVELYELS